jgi:hypothetical protein
MEKVNKIMIATSVVIALAAGGFVFHTHYVNAKEASERQTLASNIETQKAKEIAAQEAKANDPTVDESHPARYIPKTATDSSSNLGDDPNLTASVPTSKPKIVQETTKAIVTLSETDLRRLQSYSLDSNGELYVSFQDMYTNKKSECDALLKKFSPTTLSSYNKAKVGWLTSPKLVYYSPLGQYCIRGILSLTYYSSNEYGFTPNITYQGEAEYKLRNSVSDGKITLKLENTNYLSDFKAVK